MDAHAAPFNPRSVVVSAMDSPKTHSVIACASCAKAKAKCDKKVPCSRCNIKQIVCAARITRRSAHNQTRRNQPSRPKPERSIHASGTFQVSQVPQVHHHPGHNQGINGSPSHMVNHQIILPFEQDLPETHHPIPTPIMSARLAPAQSIPLAPVMMNQRMGSSMLPNGYTHTPPEMAMAMGLPMTPMVPDMPRMDNFHLMHGTSYEPQHDHFLAFHNAQASMLDFDHTNFMTDLMTPPAEPSHNHSEQFQRVNEQFQMGNHLGMPTPSQIPLPMPVRDGSGPFGLGLDLDSPRNTDYRVNASFSSSSSSATSPVPESDAAIAARHAGILALHSEIAAQHTGSLLQCNHVCMVCWTSMQHQSY